MLATISVETLPARISGRRRSSVGRDVPSSWDSYVALRPS
jgi:hypothetical protein